MDESTGPESRAAEKRRCVVLFPCFNEMDNIPSLCARVSQALTSEVEFSILIVDDGSTDETNALLPKLVGHYPVEVRTHEINRGLGAALRTGLIAAASITGPEDMVVIMDADNTQDPEHILEMARAAAAGADVVVASRYVTGGSQHGVPLQRLLLSIACNLLLSRFLRIPVRDITSGFRLIKASALRALIDARGSTLLVSRGFEATVELLFRLKQLGCKMVEVPFSLDYSRRGKASKMRVGQTILRYATIISQGTRVWDL